VTAAPRAGRLDRWRLTEPLRLYCWPVLVLLVVALVVDASASLGVIALRAASVALLIAALEAARASVYSPAGLATLAESHQQG
jgi:hypothetical protein